MSLIRIKCFIVYLKFWIKEKTFFQEDICSKNLFKSFWLKLLNKLIQKSKDPNNELTLSSLLITFSKLGQIFT